MKTYVNVNYDQIDKLILERGTTRAKCADACGIHRATLQQSFLRKSAMEYGRLEKIARFLGCDEIELTHEDEILEITAGEYRKLVENTQKLNSIIALIKEAFEGDVK